MVSKRLAHQLEGVVSTFASFAFSLPYYVLLLAVLFLLGKEHWAWSLSFLGIVLIRSVTDTLAEGLKMYAFAHGDLSVVASFLSLSPLFLVVASPLITGDHISTRGLLGVLTVVAGSLLLVRKPPGKHPSHHRGILLATGASVMFSLNSCFDRLAVQHGTPVFAGFTMTLFSAAMLAPLIWMRPQRRQALRQNAGEFWLRGFLEVTYMTSKLVALQYLQAPYVVGIQRLSLLGSIIAGRMLFKEQDFRRRLLAGLCILAGVLLIVLA